MEWTYLKDSDERPSGGYYVLVMLNGRCFTVGKWDFELQKFVRNKSILYYAIAWTYIRDEGGNILRPELSVIY